MLLDGRAPRPGEIIKLPTLAETFRELGEKGKDGFYKGRVAQEIVALIKSKGGVMELDDLAEHSSTFVEPIRYTYANEITVYEVRTSLSITFSHIYSRMVVPSERTRYSISSPS